jgi:hypothetical protein
MAAQKKKPKQEQKEPTPVRVVEPERELFGWVAPARPFKRRDREFWVTVISIAAITGIILFLIEGIMPVILIISIIFLFYVLATVEPENIEYKITNKGVKIAGKRTDWADIRRFWFSARFNSQLLIFEIVKLPGRLELVIDNKEKEKARKVLKDYVLEEELPPSGLDRAANWFSKKLPK